MLNVHSAVLRLAQMPKHTRIQENPSVETSMKTVLIAAMAENNRVI